MNSQMVTCPHCQNAFEVAEVLRQQIQRQVQQEHEKKEAQLQAELKKMQQQQLQQKSELELQAKQREEEIKEQLKQGMKQRWEEEKKRLEQEQQNWKEKVEQEQQGWRSKLEEEAKSKVELQLKDLAAQNEEKRKELETARQKELEFLKKQRELEEKEKSLELSLQRRLTEEQKKIEEQLGQRLQEENRMKMAEKDKQLEQMQRTIASLKQQSEQGSMQIQGDVQENQLKDILESNFSFDRIEDVPTGIRGADLVQTVSNQLGQTSGVLLWESKRTKAWSDDWVKKLKDDQTKVEADVAIIASQVLPEAISTFGQYHGVWVVKFEVGYVIALTSTLRFYLQEVQQVRNSYIGRDERMEYLFNYLSGNQFRTKVENIVSAFEGMRNDLESEKRAMTRIWSKREKEITRVIESTSGMYGDLQGLVGGALPSLPTLELGV